MRTSIDIDRSTLAAAFTIGISVAAIALTGKHSSPVHEAPAYACEDVDIAATREIVPDAFEDPNAIARAVHQFNQRAAKRGSLWAGKATEEDFTKTYGETGHKCLTPDGKVSQQDPVG